jgi:RND family efflux transporter MFP subunit
MVRIRPARRSHASPSLARHVSLASRGTRQQLVTWACFLPVTVASEALGGTFEGFTEPYRVIEVSATDSGKLAEVRIKRGDHVQQGELLMALDSTVLEAARHTAEARTKSTARLNALRVEQQMREDRYRQLLALQSEGAGSVEEVKRAKADTDVARLNVQAAQEELERSQLELAEIEARLDQRKIRSPITGIATDVRRDVGEYVSTQEPHVVTVVQLHELRVTFYLPTHLALTLKPGETMRLGFPDFRQQAAGQIEYVSEVTEADSGRVRVDVLLDNRKGNWRSGIRCVTNMPYSADTGMP